jgi:hypothetical protein
MQMQKDKTLTCAKDPKVVAFCQDLEELKQYIILNHTAVRKVLKKAEKKTDTPLVYVARNICLLWLANTA